MGSFNLFLIIALIGVILISGCTQSIGSFSLLESSKITRVIDGDTVVLSGGEFVRLIGIDAPESNEECYEESKEGLEKLVLGKEVILEKDTSETDRYDRLLRYIYVGENFANLEMVQAGYAYAFAYPPDTKYSEQIKEAEIEAKQNSAGCLWALAT